MKYFKKYFILLLLIFQGCTSQSQKINGISYVASGEATTQEDINNVKAIHANYAAVMPFGFIRNVETPELLFNSERQWYGETLEGVTQYTQMLQKNGIKVMLKPQIWIWHGEFTGYLKTNTEEDWKLLEDSYRNFIITYAKLSEEIQVEIFCIGTELEQFILARPQFWNSLIKEVKIHYKGKLTYAANWDEYKRVPFWEQLDYIGVDAYFPISESKTPTIEDAQLGWQKWKEELKQVSENNKKPILFTEYGYRSVAFSGKEPWKSDRSMSEANLEAQSNLMQGLFDAVYQEPWFVGGFIWKWFIDHKSVGGENDNQFTPQNKPAATIIKKHFKTINDQ